MNYQSIEPDILNYIGEGFEDFESLDTKSKQYLSGMVASDQNILTQLEIILEAIGDNAEIPALTIK